MFPLSSNRGLPGFLLSCVLLAGQAGNAHAQAPLVAPTDPSGPRPARRLLLKSGLRLTHLVYLPGQGSRQLILPVSLGVEYRLTRRFSCYSLAEADLSVGRGGGRRRGSTPTAGALFSLGTRYYYHRPASHRLLPAQSTTDDYLALEGNTDFAAPARRGRGAGTRITPGLYAFWGTQHRWASLPLLFDANAGVGIQARPHYGAEASGMPLLDVAVQINLRLYFRR